MKTFTLTIFGAFDLRIPEDYIFSLENEQMEFDDMSSLQLVVWEFCPFMKSSACRECWYYWITDQILLPNHIICSKYCPALPATNLNHTSITTIPAAHERITNFEWTNELLHILFL